MRKPKEKSFNFKDLKIKIYPEVYDPSEDTFQLLESIKFQKNDFIFEIGCGCGIISLYLCKNAVNIISSDINLYAYKNTVENFKENKDKMKGSYDIRSGDMFSVLNKDEKFDIIIFNPPYLPELQDSKIKDIWFNKAVEGGKTGLKFTKIFVCNVKKFLKKEGSSYFVFSSETNEEDLLKTIRKTKLDYKIVSTISYDSEKLKIFRLKNKN